MSSTRSMTDTELALEISRLHYSRISDVRVAQRLDALRQERAKRKAAGVYRP